MPIDLNEMERRLGIVAPAMYREFIAARDAVCLQNTNASPGALCAVNLEARANRNLRLPRDAFFLGENGEGDYYFVSTTETSGTVWFLSHETNKAKRTKVKLPEVLESLASEQSAAEVGEGQVVISRSEPWIHSILQPIEPGELPNAIEGLPGVSCFDFTLHTNPFGGEDIRVDCPGIQLQFSVDPLTLRLWHGRLEGDGDAVEFTDTLHRIARRLNARLLRSGS